MTLRLQFVCKNVQYTAPLFYCYHECPTKHIEASCWEIAWNESQVPLVDEEDLGKAQLCSAAWAMCNLELSWGQKATTQSLCTSQGCVFCYDMLWLPLHDTPSIVFTTASCEGKAKTQTPSIDWSVYGFLAAICSFCTGWSYSFCRSKSIVPFTLVLICSNMFDSFVVFIDLQVTADIIQAMPKGRCREYASPPTLCLVDPSSALCFSFAGWLGWRSSNCQSIWSQGQRQSNIARCMVSKANPRLTSDSWGIVTGLPLVWLKFIVVCSSHDKWHCLSIFFQIGQCTTKVSFCPSVTVPQCLGKGSPHLFAQPRIFS